MHSSFCILLFMFAALMASGVMSIESKPARLLVSKTFINEMTVSGKDLTVVYTLFNIGEVAARDVLLTDDGFPENDFTHVIGIQSPKFASIAPGSNVTHTVIYVPTVEGSMKTLPASVTYKALTQSDELTTVLSSTPFQNHLMSSAEYQRQHAPHLLEWAYFGLAALSIPIAMPFLMFYSSYSHDNVKKRS